MLGLYLKFDDAKLVIFSTIDGSLKIIKLIINFDAKPMSDIMCML